MIVFLEGTNRIWTTWTLFQDLIHSACLSQSTRASGPHQLWKSHLRKHTGHSKLVSLSEQQTTGGNFTMKIKRHYWNHKVFLKCCSMNKKSIHVPQQIWRSGLCHLRAWLLQKNQAFVCFSIQMKCWNVYRQRLKQFSWTVWKLALNCKKSIYQFLQKLVQKKKQIILVDLPLILSLHSLH